jgi:hemerythrin
LAITVGVKMAKLFWKDAFSVGIEKIDNQHQHMFAIINKFIERPDSAEDTEQVSQILNEMAVYAREHFADEENLMQEYGYPGLEPHKWQHAFFIDMTTELVTQFMHTQDKIADRIAEFLRLWLTGHILKTDMKYRDFFKAKIPA